ncbi:hypothetical protein ThesiDRAFT1_1618 [Thermoanaerobacter siderophilus SR4]|uniref:Uncharacterized protein n=1 Tax=Thermoanaerobacter siderophilus SR4 TaxID=880478 RepID=I9KUJ4_9THEO|nr:hypothetical protein ThesiDRAFT1_1618 [Thermoanaerobacter siderophilus SR4]
MRRWQCRKFSTKNLIGVPEDVLEDTNYLKDIVEGITIYYPKEFQNIEFYVDVEKILFMKYLTLKQNKPILKRRGG